MSRRYQQRPQNPARAGRCIRVGQATIFPKSPPRLSFGRPLLGQSSTLWSMPWPQRITCAEVEVLLVEGVSRACRGGVSRMSADVGRRGDVCAGVLSVEQATSQRISGLLRSGLRAVSAIAPRRRASGSKGGQAWHKAAQGGTGQHKAAQGGTSDGPRRGYATCRRGLRQAKPHVGEGRIEDTGGRSQVGATGRCCAEKGRGQRPQARGWAFA